MKTAAVVINAPDQQFEGLRTGLSLLLDAHEVQMFVLNHEIAQPDDAYRDNLEFFDELNGRRFSNNVTNVEEFGFTFAAAGDLAARIAAADVVIPF